MLVIWGVVAAYKKVMVVSTNCCQHQPYQSKLTTFKHIYTAKITSLYSPLTHHTSYKSVKFIQVRITQQFDISWMVTKEVDIVYDQIERGIIMKIQNVDRSE